MEEIMNLVKENAMDKITTVMAEYICDKLCRFPWEIDDQEELDDICAECKLGQHVCNVLNEYNGVFEELKRSHKNAQELAGELLREKDKQQWIPVEERLPEKYKSVLACLVNGDIGIARHYVNCWWARDTDCRYDVIAWMPLPEPYKQEEKIL